MDNIQNWIYLILGAVYFLSKLRKKNKSAAPESESQSSTMAKKVKTFEELLGEFTGLNTLEKEDNKEEKVIEVGTSSSKETANEVADKKTISSVMQVVEQPKGASELTFPKIVPLHQDQHVQEYALQDRKKGSKKIKSSEIRNELKSPSGVRKAVILSEILKRKY
jgi:hypothetical protein